MKTHDEIIVTIGRRVRAIRNEQRMTQIELAKRSRVTNVTVSNIELGKRGFSIPVLYAIAEALGISPSILVEEKQ